MGKINGELVKWCFVGVRLESSVALVPGNHRSLWDCSESSNLALGRSLSTVWTSRRSACITFALS